MAKNNLLGEVTFNIRSQEKVLSFSMNMLFQHLLFILLNLHLRHHEYIITSMIFTIYHHF